MESLDAAVAKANEASGALDLKRAQTDEFLDKLSRFPEYAGVYEELIQKRSDSRGFYDAYVAPAWNYLKGLVSSPADSGMGIVPLVVYGVAAGVASIAVIGAAYAFVSVADSNKEKELAILNTNLLTPEQKAKILSSGSTLGNVQNIAVVGVIGLSLVLVMRLIGSRR